MLAANVSAQESATFVTELELMISRSLTADLGEQLRQDRLNRSHPLWTMSGTPARSGFAATDYLI